MATFLRCLNSWSRLVVVLSMTAAGACGSSKTVNEPSTGSDVDASPDIDASGPCFIDSQNRCQRTSSDGGSCTDVKAGKVDLERSCVFRRTVVACCFADEVCASYPEDDCLVATSDGSFYLSEGHLLAVERPDDFRMCTDDERARVVTVETRPTCPE